MPPEISASAGTGPASLEAATTPRADCGGSLASAEVLKPNALVRWAYGLSIFAIPFTKLYLPGSGDRIGVSRLIQALIICAALSQPRVCLRLVPTALLWFLAYCVARIVAGLSLTPELASLWWPDTLEWLQFSLPWAWVLFNVLQFPNVRRSGLWAFVSGCLVCALCHLAGLGVVELDKGVEGRSSVFGENANVVGATYAIALIVIVSLGLFHDAKMSQRLGLVAMLGIIGVGMAKTGSRTSGVILVIGLGALLFYGQVFGSRIKRYASVLLVGGVLAAVAWKIPTVMERFGKLDSSRIEKQEGRVRMMPVLWEVFLRSPLYGSGPYDYQYELTRRAMPHLLKDQRLIASHNLALLLLAETGIIGFLLFAFGVKGAVVSAWRARLKPCGSLPLALILPLAVASLVIGDPSHHPVFWFAMACALAGNA